MDLNSLLPKILDLLVDAVCVVDEEGTFVFVSAACERIFGYTQEELIGRNMIELVHPADRARTLETADSIMEGEPQVHFENRYLRKDGQVVHIMWSARWVESERLRLAVARDVTELRRAERLQRALYEISEAAHAAGGLPALYRHIHRIIDGLLPAQNFFVALYDTFTGTVSFPYFADEKEPAPADQPLITGTPVATVIESGQPLLIRSDRNADNTAEQPEPFSTWLGVPLTSEGNVIGALAVRSYSRATRYTEEHKELLCFISTQVAATIVRMQAETRLFYLAHHDALTGLPNRTLFGDRFDMALRQAARKGDHVALLCLDLDGFKAINDSFGHGVGDQVLCEVAARLQRYVRDSDTVARMGGDEFSILLLNLADAADADIAAEKIRAVIKAPFVIEGQEIQLSASIGLSLFPEQGSEPEELYHQADVSMYAAKRRV